jgi:4-hydroxythreonine-4-phosphate dehydrogenase
MKPRLAVSIGDLNGIGIEIALKAHESLTRFCDPHYVVHFEMAEQAAEKLGVALPEPFDHTAPDAATFAIRPGEVRAESGAYAFASFRKGVALVEKGRCDALVTLPIHKEAWMKAGIPYKGHTDALRDIFRKEAIMMLGCEALYVALYTEHIPLKAVPKELNEERLARFLVDFARETGAEKVGVLGLNPHAGDHGVLGDEERIIEKAIRTAHSTLNTQHPKLETSFVGPLVPDVAFTPKMRERFRHFVAMYHDQGLAPLKALYFDESVNVSLNLPIVRTSVDHGTAFDIAYLPERPVNLKSYVNAAEAAVSLLRKRQRS